MKRTPKQSPQSPVHADVNKVGLLWRVCHSDGRRTHHLTLRRALRAAGLLVALFLAMPGSAVASTHHGHHHKAHHARVHRVKAHRAQVESCEGPNEHAEEICEANLPEMTDQEMLEAEERGQREWVWPDES